MFQINFIKIWKIELLDFTLSKIAERNEQLMRGKKSKCQNKSIDDLIEKHMSDEHMKQLNIIDGVSFSGIVAKNFTTKVCKSIRYAGSRILSLAKSNIIKQAHKMYKLFKLKLGIKEIHPYICLIDTDSLGIMLQKFLTNLQKFLLKVKFTITYWKQC